MQRIALRSLPWILSTSLSLLTAGCISPNAPKTQFYQLNPQVSSTTDEQATETPSAGLQPNLGVGPVELAGYLDRPQLVDRDGPYRLKLNDFEHWAGSLQDNILNGLVDALRAYLGRNQVVSYPWHPTVRPVRELVLDVNRFDWEGRRFVIKVQWVLLTDRGDQLLAVRQWEAEEPVDDFTPDAQVAAASRALSRLAEHLAVSLRHY